VRLSGTGNPQGNISAAVGSEYVDTNTSYVYSKNGGGSTAYGWYPQTAVIGQFSRRPMIAILANSTTNPFITANGFGPPFNPTTAGSLGFSQSVGNTSGTSYVGGRRYGTGSTTTGAAAPQAFWTLATSATDQLLQDDVDIWIDMLTDAASIADNRIWFGWTVGQLTMNTTNTASAYAGTTWDAMIIRYLGDANAIWEGLTTVTGSATRTVTTTLGNGAANTAYRLRIRFVRQGTPTVYFSVNDGTEVSTTLTIPAANVQPMTLIFGICKNSGSTSRVIGWNNMGGVFGS
jgi:hypothetical protein